MKKQSKLPQSQFIYLEEKYKKKAFLCLEGQKKIMKENNIAFVDGQNLYLWTKSENWEIDLKKFRVYLKYKFKAEKTYYFIGYFKQEEENLYKYLKESWYILIFREHCESMIWKKKWNIDVDLVFEMMLNVIENKDFDRFILVSWDWDYIKPVKYFIKKGIMKKVLSPNKKYSSLYKQIHWEFIQNISEKQTRKKFEKK